MRRTIPSLTGDQGAVRLLGSLVVPEDYPVASSPAANGGIGVGGRGGE